MRVINVSLSELETKVLLIGFEGENQITQVRIDAAEILTDHPNATPTLIAKPLFGFAYPVIVAKEGTDVVWEIDNSVLSFHGDGEIQLTFTEGTVIAKSYVGRIRIKRSLSVNGEAPDPIETWEQAATAKLAEVDAQIGELEDMVDAAEAAKDEAQDIVDDAAADIQAAGAAQVQVVQAKGTEVLNSIPSDYSTLSGDVNGLKSALNDINNNVFQVSAYSGTITGTGIVTVNINTVPAGTYNLSIERVTSTDTDYPKCVIALQNGSSTVKNLTVDRNVAIQQELTLDQQINKITVYASQTAGGSTGDTVTVENMQIYNDSALGQRLSDMEEGISENAEGLSDVSEEVAGKASSVDFEQLEKLVIENATDYIGGWSQGYWSDVTTIWNNANVCCNTVSVSVPAKAILEIVPNGQYVLIQDGTSGALAQTSCLFDGVTKNASVSYQTASKVETVPITEARTYFIRVAETASPNTAFLPSEVLATMEIRYADDTKDRAEIGSYNINKTDLQDGSLNYTTGSEEANQNILRTGFIPVESGEIYEIYSNRDIVNDVAYIFEYASDKSFIRYNTSLANKSWWKMSDTTKYVRIRTQSASASYPKPDKDTLVIAVDKWYRRNTFNEDALLKGYDAFSVVGRQKDVYPHVCASAGYGLHNNGVKNYRKMFSMMLTTDVHYCASALMAAVDYMNETPSIDCGICLGDMQSGNFGQNPSDWYAYAVNKSNKPFFTVIGNHDGGEGSALSTAGSTQAVFETFVEPTIDKIGISDLDTIYYAKTFTEYGIVLIVLNDFDLPDTLSDSTHYLVPRNTYDFVSQAQVNWLINTLRNVPSGYHVMIARHDSPSAATSVESVWTQPGMIAEGCGAIYSGDIVPDIVNAWMNGSSLSQSYSPISAFASLGDITVNADFSSRGEGVFIGYIQGHTHTDVHAKDTKYPNQNVFVVTTSANDLYQPFRSDLPRVRGTKMDECFTVLSVDKTNRAVNVVRVGSAITSIMTNRTMYRFNY